MQNQRRHDIDALRALAFGLLILYHIGMFYVSWGWHLKSNYPAHWLEPLMLMVNQWRMPLIFLISGLAVHFLRGGEGKPTLDDGRLAWLRTKRLLLPLLFGMAVVVLPQAYLEGRAQGLIEPGYGQFLWHYFSFQPWPEGAFAGAENGVTWMHLWYLPYLLFYTLLLLPLARLLDGPLAGLVSRIQALRGIWLLIVPTLWLLPLGLWLYPLFPYISHDLTSDWYAHAMYGSFFLFGYLLGRDSALWRELVRIRWLSLVLAPIAFIVLRLSSDFAWPEDSLLATTLQSLITYFNRCVWIAMILGWGHHALNRPMAWLSYANRAVYPWYILHQTVIIIIGYQFNQIALGPVLEPLALIALTVAGCAAIMAVIDHWLPWLRPFMGMPTRPSMPLGHASEVRAT
ncbi:MAG: acyltransferase family protein [Wenzhouxiangellaceae bacterium]